MTSEILKTIVHTLEVLEIFDRSSGILPTLLLDDHESRLQLPFLQYVNDPAHIWAVLIGVPYGTSLWQVGDRNEQNGAYKMALDRIKKDIISFKERRMMPILTIEVHEIIILVNFAWEQSFARVE